MTVTGGTYIGASQTSTNCQNCGHPSHCGTPLLEDYRNWKGEHMGQIKVCDSCRCKNCAELDLPHPGDVGC